MLRGWGVEESEILRRGDSFTGWRDLRRSGFDQLKSKLTWPKFPTSMRLKQKWNRNNDYWQKCCFYWVITWELLFRRGLTFGGGGGGAERIKIWLEGEGGGGVDFLSGGYERIFGWWGDSPHLPSRENPVIITYAPESFRILFI